MSNSKSDSQVAAYLASIGIIACNTFAPHFQTEFTDKNGNVRVHQPDYVTTFDHANGKPLFIEAKFATLNSKGSFKTASKYIIDQHAWQFKCPPKTYNQACDELWSYNSKTGLYVGQGKGDKRKDVLEGAWNHAEKKQLITQAAIGTENFVVVFADYLFTPENEPKFEKYREHGLNLIKLSELEAYIQPVWGSSTKLSRISAFGVFHV